MEEGPNFAKKTLKSECGNFRIQWEKENFWSTQKTEKIRQSFFASLQKKSENEKEKKMREAQLEKNGLKEKIDY